MDEAGNDSWLVNSSSQLIGLINAFFPKLSCNFELEFHKSAVIIILYERNSVRVNTYRNVGDGE